ncbi:putative acyl-CoA-binding protein [Hypsibius exemplaris]|nr:putative acyl-CoA-binding protein [Hypsibius exemplaris]
MSVEEQFKTSAEQVKKLKSSPSDTELLELYSLYKQATIGDVNTDRPGMLYLKEKAKWDAWNGRKGLGKEQAQELPTGGTSSLTHHHVRPRMIPQISIIAVHVLGKESGNGSRLSPNDTPRPDRFGARVAVLLAGTSANNSPTTRYDSLYRGAAYTVETGFSGSSYWTSGDGEWQGYAYYGIKYANAKRFEPSTLNFDHDYRRNISRTQRGPICPQQATEVPYTLYAANIMSEDCLALDVYVPPVYKAHTTLGWSKWPVLIWIHGGDFRMGMKDAFEGGELASSLGAVVVVPNYRVGALGFLSSGDKNAPGNWALYDLKLAIKWVHTHAHAFGGDKTKLTLAGERAGGALVSMLLLDEDIRALVHGGMTLSGNVFSPWAIQREPVAVARLIAADLDCPNETALMISCLRRVAVNDLLDASARAERTLGRHGLVTPLWAPVVDGTQIQFSPKWLPEGSAWDWKGGYVTGYLTNDAVNPLLSSSNEYCESHCGSLFSKFLHALDYYNFCAT